jgi:hypothetical protein
MNSADEYRNNAEDCMRMASLARDEGDRPLWVTMAQSWLRLAEHADHINGVLESDDHAPGQDEPDMVETVSEAY